MNSEVPSVTLPPPGWRRGACYAENLLVSLVLAALVLLPLTEVLLRKFFSVGISGATALVQHLTLFIGMLGGAIAARDNRLLALSTVDNFLKGRWQTLARVLGHGIGAAVVVLLGVAAMQFVLFEKEGGGILVYGVPRWVVQLVLPAGFGIIAVRMLWHTSPKLAGRVAATLLAAAILAFIKWTPIDPANLVVICIIGVVLAALAGAPVFTVLGGAALILFWGQGEPVASIPLDHYRLVTNPSLPTIPLFTLAGYFLAEGGASKRLIRVFQALFGSLRGGPAVMTALVCAFFTSFTGASGVTILALGGLLMPVLLSAKYSERNALGLLTGAGSLGLLFPPCLPLILYAIVAKVTMEEMFLGGILPGLLLVGMTAWWGIRVGPKKRADRQPFHPGEAARATWEAKWELLLPVVALVGLFSGWATPVEAAAVTALYAFAIETFVYRDLKLWKDVPRVMTECGLLVGGVLLILGVALGFTNYLVDAEVPAQMVDWAKSSIHATWVFLLLLNIFLLIVGCLMDIYSAIVVVVPLIVPIGLAFGVDPVHLGIIFLANLELGYLTPPVGMNLFLSSYRFGKPLPEVTRATLPMLGVLAIGVVLITYLPFLTKLLPNLLLK